jgi:hypothetical protein
LETSFTSWTNKISDFSSHAWRNTVKKALFLLGNSYTAKNAQACNNVVENKPEQYFAAHIDYCSWLLTIFFSIVQAEQCWTILLTTRNNNKNMGSKILFKLVFINIVTGWAFLLCKQEGNIVQAMYFV